MCYTYIVILLGSLIPDSCCNLCGKHPISSSGPWIVAISSSDLMNGYANGQPLYSINGSTIWKASSCGNVQFIFCLWRISNHLVLNLLPLILVFRTCWGIWCGILWYWVSCFFPVRVKRRWSVVMCVEIWWTPSRSVQTAKRSLSHSLAIHVVSSHISFSSPFFSLPPSLLYTLSPSFAPSLLSFLPHSFASPSLLSSLLPFSLPPLPDAGILLQCEVSEVGLVRW